MVQSNTQGRIRILYVIFHKSDERRILKIYRHAHVHIYSAEKKPNQRKEEPLVIKILKIDKREEKNATSRIYKTNETF